MEYQVDIAGVMYGMKDIQTVTITQSLFDKPSVGNACCAELAMTLWPKSDIPRMAKIIPYCREEDEEEWFQLGIFFIDTREVSDSKLSIVAYDPMLKGESIWGPDKSLFPVTMRQASEMIAELIEAPLDERCSFNDSYMVPYPEEDYTIRDILCHIAAAHAGNWIITAEGKLLLIPFNYYYELYHYLVTEDDNPITFGGNRIRVVLPNERNTQYRR